MRGPGATLVLLVVVLLTVHDASMAATGHPAAGLAVAGDHSAHGDAESSAMPGDCGMVRLVSQRPVSTTDDALPLNLLHDVPAVPSLTATGAISVSFLVNPVFQPTERCRAFFQVFRI